MTQPQGPSAAGQHQALAQAEPRGSGSTKPSQLFPPPPPPPPALRFLFLSLELVTPNNSPLREGSKLRPRIKGEGSH